MPEYFRTQTENIKTIEDIKKAVFAEEEDGGINYIGDCLANECEVLTLAELRNELIAEYKLHKIVFNNIRWGDLIEDTCKIKGYAVVVRFKNEYVVAEADYALGPLNRGFYHNPEALHSDFYIVRPLT